MANIAQKLEQLEMALSSTTQYNAFLSHLASDTVHYNPSNLSNWLESMLSELNAPPPPISSCTPIPNHQSNQFELPPVPATSTTILDLADCSTMTTIDFPTPRHQAEYDLKPTSSTVTIAPGHVVHGSKPPMEVNSRDRKRMRTSSSSSSRGGGFGVVGAGGMGSSMPSAREALSMTIGPATEARRSKRPRSYRA